MKIDGIFMVDGLIVNLDLSNNKLQGILPASIGALRHLKELHLYNNRIEGEVPITLRTMRQLQILYLNGNAFSGILPGLSHLVSSKTLVVKDNRNLSGDISKSLVAQCGNIDYSNCKPRSVKTDDGH